MKNTTAEILNDFWNAPGEALFDQKIVATITCHTPAWCEHWRWRGGGIPYRKIGRRCLYSKKDIVTWLDKHKILSSTSERE